MQESPESYSPWNSWSSCSLSGLRAESRTREHVKPIVTPPGDRLHAGASLQVRQLALQPSHGMEMLCVALSDVVLSLSPNPQCPRPYLKVSPAISPLATWSHREQETHNLATPPSVRSLHPPQGHRQGGVTRMPGQLDSQ